LLVIQTAAAETAGSQTDSQLAAPAVNTAGRDSEDSKDETRYYSDSFLPLRDSVRAFERDPANRYTYCIRSVATYECLSYGSDGDIRRRQHQTTAHGTGFAYLHDGEETRILTNEHVVAWPYVTDPEHRAEDVPLGCKLVNRKMSIVDNDEDEFDEDDIPLSLVLEDRSFDVAVVRARGKLRLLPYRIGRSSALNTGDVVIVRGFPLGVFQAHNTGKITNTLDVDKYRQWDHVDFIVDAQLSPGNSGSPVLALNRKTGEYELVGVYHATYMGASSLHAVIAVDQLRELMFQLKRENRPQLAVGLEQLSDSAQRARVQKALTDKDFIPYVGLGPLLVRLQPLGDNLLFEVFSRRFPLDDHPVALLLDAPAGDGWGRLQQVFFGNHRGYRLYGVSDVDSQAALALKHVLQRIYAQSYSTLAYRQLLGRVPTSRQAVDQRIALERALSRAAAQDTDLAQQLLDVAKERSPTTAETALPLAEVFSKAYSLSSLTLRNKALTESRVH